MNTAGRMAGLLLILIGVAWLISMGGQIKAEFIDRPQQASPK